MRIRLLLKSLALVLSAVFIYFIPLIISRGGFKIYYSLTGILFIVLGSLCLSAILFVVIKYVLKIPDDIEIDYARKIVRLRYGDKIVELPYTSIYYVDLNQYLKICVGGVSLPNLIAGKFKTVNNEYVYVYSESSKAVVVETLNGKKYVYTAPKNYYRLLNQ